MSRKIVLAELWLGLLLGPMAVLIQLEINYALLVALCSNGQEWVLHLMSVVALAATFLGGTLSYRNWRADNSIFADQEAGVSGHLGFMATLGVWISVMMALAVIAQWIAVFIYAPCQRWN